MEQRDTQQNNQTNSNGHNGQTLTNKAESDFYQKHASMSVIIKKTEKITTAIYMVTDFVHESEPLRARLRTLALALNSGTRKIGSRSSEPHYSLADEVGRTIEETISLIELATTIGLVSNMNGQILRTELEKTKHEIEVQYGDKKVFVTTHPGYANILLNPTMFDVSLSETVLPKPSNGQEIYKGQTVNQNTENFPTRREVHQSFKAESFSKKSDLGMKIARRNDVLNVVRSKGKVSIKDITSILKDTSEKTVQRELKTLVEEGVLIKEGEKRWSMYRIAS